MNDFRICEIVRQMLLGFLAFRLNDGTTSFETSLLLTVCEKKHDVTSMHLYVQDFSLYKVHKQSKKTSFFEDAFPSTATFKSSQVLL